jgi:hypothetical protein
MKGINRNNSIWDFAFKQIRESLGGHAKFIITGSAPISPEVSVIHLPICYYFNFYFNYLFIDITILKSCLWLLCS